MRRLGRDMAEAEMIDMSFRGPDGNIHNDGSWICPECFAALMEGP